MVYFAGLASPKSGGESMSTEDPHDATHRQLTTSESIAARERTIGASFEKQLRDAFSLAESVADLAGDIMSVVADAPGAPRAIHVGAIILARQLTDLRACAHLIRLGLAVQATTIAAGMVEHFFVGAYIGEDEERAQEWLDWTSSHTTYPKGGFRSTVVAAAAKIGAPAETVEQDYDGVYRMACMVKHGNPLAMGSSQVHTIEKMTHIVAGPLETEQFASLGHAAMHWAIRYTLLAARVFALCHVSNERRREFEPRIIAVRQREKTFVSTLHARFPEGDD